MNKRIVATGIRSVANILKASSPFNMTEIELELYNNLEKLHKIVTDAKDEVAKFFDKTEAERDPSDLQMKLDTLDKNLRDLSKVTDGFYAFVVKADEAINNLYNSVKMGNVEQITEYRADIELLAGQIFSEYQKLRQR